MRIKDDLVVATLTLDAQYLDLLKKIIIRFPHEWVGGTMDISMFELTNDRTLQSYTLRVVGRKFKGFFERRATSPTASMKSGVYYIATASEVAVDDDQLDYIISFLSSHFDVRRKSTGNKKWHHQFSKTHKYGKSQQIQKWTINLLLKDSSDNLPIELHHKNRLTQKSSSSRWWDYVIQ